MKFKKYKSGRKFKADELYLKLVTEDGEVKLTVVDHEGSNQTYLCSISPEGLKLYAYASVVETKGDLDYIKTTKEKT